MWNIRENQEPWKTPRFLAWTIRKKKKWSCILPRWRRLGTDCNKGGMSEVKIKMSGLDVLSFAVKKAVGQVHRSGVQRVYLKIQTVIISAQILFKVMNLREILGLGSGADQTKRDHIPLGTFQCLEFGERNQLRKLRKNSLWERKEITMSRKPSEGNVSRKKT